MGRGASCETRRLPANGANPLVVLRRFLIEAGFLSRPVPGVAAKHPVPQTADAEQGDQQRETHREPGRHPLTGKKEHVGNYREHG